MVQGVESRAGVVGDVGVVTGARSQERWVPKCAAVSPQTAASATTAAVAIHSR